MPNSTRTQKDIETRNKKAYIGSKEVEDQLHDVKFSTSSLETIDKAVLNYLDKLNIAVTTNKGFKKVPVLWVSAERAYQLKHNKDLRDSEEALILPLITIDRVSVEKNPASEYAVPAANIPEVRDAMGGAITIARRLNQRETAQHQNAYSKRVWKQATSPRVEVRTPVYETITVPFPTWVAVSYQVSARTEYQQQTNEILTKFIRQGGLNRMPARLESDGHKFEAFIDGSVTNNSNVASMGMDQRNYETIINIKVLGYLFGDGENQERPNIVVRRQNAVKVQIPRETVITEQPLNFPDNSGFYT